MAIVIDASVAVKWVIEEDFSDRAEALLRQTTANDEPLIAPPHFTAEVINALYQRVRRSQANVALTELQASGAVQRFVAFEVRSVAPDGLYADAFLLAATHRMVNIYDALYVTLARMAGADLWTADLRLLRSLGSAAPWVRWIGDYGGDIASS